MELRLVIAYGLMSVIALGLLVFGLVTQRRRERRKRRLRGIKTDERARLNGRSPA